MPTQEQRRKEEEEQKRQYEAFLETKKKEEMEEEAQNQETAHRLNALKAATEQSDVNSAMLSLMENFNGTYIIKLYEYVLPLPEDWTCI